jgi:microcystin-dependent protein
MTISNTTVKHVYSGNGVATRWDYTFKILQTSDIQVYLTSPAGITEQVTANYSIDVNNKQVVYPAVGAGMQPLADGWQITLLRAVPQTQDMDLQNQGAYDAEDIESGFDKLTMLLQEISEKLRRTVSLPVTSDTSAGDIADYIDQMSVLLKSGIDQIDAISAANIEAVDAIKQDAQTAENNAAGSATASGNSAAAAAESAVVADAAADRALAASGIPGPYDGETGHAHTGEDGQGPKVGKIGLTADVAGYLVPTGGIIMWSGKIADIPSGWYLCDGNNGTPDLRDRFIVGARQDADNIAKTNVSGSLSQTGGAATKQLTTNEMPVHEHPGNITSSPGSGTPVGSIFVPSGSVQTKYVNRTVSPIESTDVAGNGSAFSILNPYYALAFIMKS